jgi:hypothetical protein
MSWSRRVQCGFNDSPGWGFSTMRVPPVLDKLLFAL